MWRTQSTSTLKWAALLLGTATWVGCGGGSDDTKPVASTSSSSSTSASAPPSPGGGVPPAPGGGAPSTPGGTQVASAPPMSMPGMGMRPPGAVIPGSYSPPGGTPGNPTMPANGSYAPPGGIPNSGSGAPGGYAPPGGIPNSGSGAPGSYAPPGGIPNSGSGAPGGYAPPGGIPNSGSGAPGGYAPPGGIPNSGSGAPGGYAPPGGIPNSGSGAPGSGSGAPGGYAPPGGIPGNPTMPNSFNPNAAFASGAGGRPNGPVGSAGPDPTKEPEPSGQRLTIWNFRKVGQDYAVSYRFDKDVPAKAEKITLVVKTPVAGDKPGEFEFAGSDFRKKSEITARDFNAGAAGIKPSEGKYEAHFEAEGKEGKRETISNVAVFDTSPRPGPNAFAGGPGQNPYAAPGAPGNGPPGSFPSGPPGNFQGSGPGNFQGSGGPTAMPNALGGPPGGPPGGPNGSGPMGAGAYGGRGPGGQGATRQPNNEAEKTVAEFLQLAAEEDPSAAGALVGKKATNGLLKALRDKKDLTDTMKSKLSDAVSNGGITNSRFIQGSTIVAVETPGGVVTQFKVKKDGGKELLVDMTSRVKK